MENAFALPAEQTHHRSSPLHYTPQVHWYSHPSGGQMCTANWPGIWKSEVQKAVHFRTLDYLSGIRKLGVKKTFSFLLFSGSLLQHLCTIHIWFSCSANLEVCQTASRGRLQDLNEHLPLSLFSQKHTQFPLAEDTAWRKCPNPHRSWHQLPFLPRLLSLFCKIHVWKNLQSQWLTWQCANLHLLPGQLKSPLIYVLHELLPTGSKGEAKAEPLFK